MTTISALSPRVTFSAKKAPAKTATPKKPAPIVKAANKAASSSSAKPPVRPTRIASAPQPAGKPAAKKKWPQPVSTDSVKPLQVAQTEAIKLPSASVLRDHAWHESVTGGQVDQSEGERLIRVHGQGYVINSSVRNFYLQHINDDGARAALEAKIHEMHSPKDEEPRATRQRKSSGAGQPYQGYSARDY